MITPDEIARTDPGFARIVSRFEAEVHEHGGLDERSRALCVLAALIALDETDEFVLRLGEALNGVLTPFDAREVVYQSAAYCGTPRAKRFLAAANGVFASRGVALPLPTQNPGGDENRREAGTRVQIALFGEDMADFWQSGPEETRCINRWLTEHCYGDFYARPGLSLSDRELIAFSFLTALGEDSAQMKARVVAGYAAGNDRAVLIAAIVQLLPFIGWPRALSALTVLNETDRELNDDGYDDDPF